MLNGYTITIGYQTPHETRTPNSQFLGLTKVERLAAFISKNIMI